MPITVNAYYSGDFDTAFLALQNAAGGLTSLQPNRMVYGTVQPFGPGGSLIYISPQVVLNGSGFTNGSSGTVNSVVIGNAGVSASAPGSAPLYSIQGLNVLTATFLQDELAAIKSDAVTFNGTSGADIFVGGVFSDTLLGFAGHDSFSGGIGADTLRGGPGNDRLAGGKGFDFLYGGADNDILIGGRGPDLLDGGDGADTASYQSGEEAVIVDLTTPSLNTGHAAGDTFINIENVEGSTFGDHLYGNSGSNTLIGGYGSDVIYGREGDDFIYGGFAPFGLRDYGDDVMFGGQGNDTFNDELGADTFSGGAGRDTFIIYGGSAILGRGNDVITDFNPAQDYLVLHTYFEDRDQFDAAMQQVGNNVVVTSEYSPVTLTLLNTTVSTMLVADVEFLFL